MLQEAEAALNRESSSPSSSQGLSEMGSFIDNDEGEAGEGEVAAAVG